jgi:hypothetical protein
MSIQKRPKMSIRPKFTIYINEVCASQRKEEGVEDPGLC